MEPIHRRLPKRMWAAVGGALCCLALFVPGSSIEHMLGRSPGDLSWGTALFRSLLAIHGLALLWVGLRRSGPAPAMAKFSRTETGAPAWILLSAMSLVALGLRLYRLGNGLWLDEVLTLLDFVRPPLGWIASSFPAQNQHMLYSILAHLSVDAFGENAAALRLPAVLFGVASVPALFLLTRKLAGVREALLASALMTFSYHHVWFSQNARGYTGLLFFTLLATWLWLEASERDSWRWWIAYSAAIAMGGWIHVTMALVAASHGIVYLWRLARRRDRVSRKPLWALSLAFTFTLQLYALSLPQFLATALREFSPQSEWTNPLWMVRESLRSLSLGFSGLAAASAGGVMTLIGWWSIWRRNRDAALVMVLPALLGAAAVLSSGHNLWPRFFFFSMGFGLLIVVHGAMAAPRLLLSSVLPDASREKVSSTAGLVLASLLILASASTLPKCYRFPKQDFIGARDYVEHSLAPGDAVVAVGLASRVYQDYYAPGWAAVRTAGDLDAVRNSAKSVWLVYTLPVEVRANHPRIWEMIRQDFQLVKTFPGTLGGGALYVCRGRQDSRKSGDL